MSELIEIKHRYTGEVLFAHECEDNTIRNTVEQAVKEGVSLDWASLEGASLEGASLDGASLYGASLDWASLDGASLDGASLDWASLDGASLDGASLKWASLFGASLEWASLDGASLKGATLDGASLKGATGKFFVPLACPSDGAFVGWKKVNEKLVKLIVPSGAKRSSATSRKCRAEFVEVIEITDIDGNNPIEEITNTSRTPHTIYKVGEITKADSWDENRFNECSHGIHFFINKQEAIDYEF